MEFYASKTLLKWREPLRIFRAKAHVEKRARRLWQRPLAVLRIALVTGLVYGGVAYLLGTLYGKPPFVYLGVVALLLVLGAFQIYVAPALVLRFGQAYIRIHETGVTYHVVTTPSTCWPFEKIQGFRITSTGAGGEQLLELSLRLQDGVALLGIAPDVETDQLRQILVEHGVGEDTDDGDDRAGGSLAPEPRKPQIEAAAAGDPEGREE